MTKAKTLKNYRQSPADICRENGWEVGDNLEGNEGNSLCRLQITAIGEASILAKCLLHERYERSWLFQKAEWRKVS